MVGSQWPTVSRMTNDYQKRVDFREALGFWKVLRTYCPDVIEHDRQCGLKSCSDIHSSTRTRNTFMIATTSRIALLLLYVVLTKPKTRAHHKDVARSIRRPHSSRCQPVLPESSTRGGLPQHCICLEVIPIHKRLVQYGSPYLFEPRTSRTSSLLPFHIVLAQGNH